MGPRPIGRGNTGPAPGHARAVYASMGPRPIGRGNSPLWARRGIPMAKLQWGRDRSVAEILALHEAPGPVAHASMGPRPIGRGNVRIPRGRGGAPPWLQWGRDRSVAEIIPKLDGRLRADLLQWGRDRSVAEMCEYRAGAAAPRRGFNGAATDRSRKSFRSSTGGCARTCFNGAATDRSRKWFLAAPSITMSGAGFNGAATDRSRKSRAVGQRGSRP